MCSRPVFDALFLSRWIPFLDSLDSGSFQARRVGFRWMASGKVRYIHFLTSRKKTFIERRRRHFWGNFESKYEKYTRWRRRRAQICWLLPRRESGFRAPTRFSLLGFSSNLISRARKVGFQFLDSLDSARYRVPENPKNPKESIDASITVTCMCSFSFLSFYPRTETGNNVPSKVVVLSVRDTFAVPNCAI